MTSSPAFSSSLAFAASWVAPALSRLARASLAGAIAVALVYLVVRLAPRLPPALRSTLWWLACLKLLLALVWVRPLTIPLPASLAAHWPMAATSSRAGAESESGRGVETAREAEAIAIHRTAVPGESLASPSSSRATEGTPWGSLALTALWIAGVAVGLARTGRQLLAARRILRGARPVGSSPLAARFAELAREMGLAHPPALLASAAVDSPLTLGAARPAVVLPAGAVALSAGQLEMALCHELAHVRRRDLWLGWVPTLATRLFFFHPLVHLAAREHALAREAACDAEVLARLAAPPAAYARLLLAFGAVGGVGARSGAAALGAAPPPGTLKRRLLMLDSVTRRPRAAWLGLAGLAALAALVPVRLALASAPSAPASLSVAPVESTAPAAPVGPAVSAVQTAPVPAVRPVVASPARTPVAFVVAAAPPPAQRERRGHDSSSADAFVLLGRNGNSTMSGSTGDLARVRELAGPGGEILWFRRGGHEYVIRDAALLAKAQELYAPQAELGKRQGELGARQGELGAKQGELGAKQGELGSRQGALGAKQAAMASRQATASEKDAEGLERDQEQLSQDQDELGRRQDELGQQQDKLGREQDRLGREADAKLRILLDD
ncbi:MAG TPA: M56 family metallopeptidase, partial [Thermoanaerobaculia bacterium]